MLEAIRQLNPYLSVAVTAMLPVLELRGSIPLGVIIFGMNPFITVVLSIVAMMITTVLWFLFLRYITDWARSLHPTIDKFFEWLFAKTYHRHNANFERWGSWALMIFVATPLPFTGAWTGALLAHLFGIKFVRAMVFIVIGLLITGLIMVAISLGGVRILGL